METPAPTPIMHTSDPNIGPGNNLANWIMAAAAVILTAARLYTRAVIVRKLALCDWVVSIAVLLGIGSTIILNLAINLGLGQHIDRIPLNNLVALAELGFLFQPFVVMAACLTRVSIALLLLEVVKFRAGNRRFLYCLIAVQLIANTSQWILIFAECRPARKLWDYSVPGTCWELMIQSRVGYFVGVLNSLTDLILAFFPVSFLYSLQVKRATKFTVGAVMGGFSLLTMGASIYKMWWAKRLNDAAQTPEHDTTYAFLELARCFIVELRFGLMAATVPILKPLFVKLFPCICRSSRGARRPPPNPGQESHGRTIACRLRQNRNGLDVELGNMVTTATYAGNDDIPIADRPVSLHGPGVIHSQFEVTIEFEEARDRNRNR